MFLKTQFKPPCAMLALLLLAGCAGIPPERGLAEVRQMAADRGQAVPDPSDADREALNAELLAQPLSEAAAVRLAFLNSPRLQAEFARLGLSAADAVQAGRLSNPQFAAAYFFSSSAASVNRYDLGLSQNLVELLILPARTRFATGEFERARLGATQALLELAADVQSAWYAAVGDRQIEAMRRTLAAAAGGSAELAQRFKDAGNLTALQLAVEMSAASQAQLDLEQAQAQAGLSRNALNRLMGLAADAAWTLPEALPAPVEHEDALDALQQLANEKRADLASARRAVALLEDSLGLTRRFRYLGSVEVGVDHERDSDRNRLLGPSLSLELPIFNQGQATLLRAQAQLDAARADLRAKELEVGSDIAAAHDRVMATRQRGARLAKETIPLRETIVARMQEQLNYMLVGIFDTLRARADEYAAYQQYLESLRDYWQARVGLARAVGSRLPSDGEVGKAVIAPAHPEDAAVEPRENGMQHLHHGGQAMAPPTP